MSERAFFDKEARKKVKETIESVEAQTSAELVVAIRKQASNYRHVDIAMGSAVAFVVLLLLLFLPWPFDVNWMPVEVALGFAVGAVLSSTFWSLKRSLTRNRCLQQSTWRCACTLFHEKGITRTSGRNGILVLVTMLERRVDVVTDIGIDVEALGPDWQDTLKKLRDTIRIKPNLDAFTQTLAQWGPILGASMPRAEDDINELPDEPDVS